MPPCPCSQHGHDINALGKGDQTPLVHAILNNKLKVSIDILKNYLRGGQPYPIAIPLNEGRGLAAEKRRRYLNPRGEWVHAHTYRRFLRPARGYPDARGLWYRPIGSGEKGWVRHNLQPLSPPR